MQCVLQIPQKEDYELYTNGTHLMCEFSGCDARIIGDVDAVRDILFKAATEAKAEIMEVSFHRFFPQGVSGVVVISESHLSIHSWPEYGYAAVDIYTCGDHTDPEAALQYCARAFGATATDIVKVNRGLPKVNGEFTYEVVNKANSHS